MNKLNVAFLPDANTITPVNEISALLDRQPAFQLDNLLWPVSNYKPSVNFSIAYGNDHIFLKFRVEEQFTKAEYTVTNSPVYKDSCVEFFVAFNNEATYYNLEFNPLGTALAGYGNGRTRELLPVELIEKIKSYPVTPQDDTAPGLQSWQLTLAIPFELFLYHDLNSLTGLTCHGNFYKCGDGLPQPHFLSWNYIYNPVPDFHLPQFFGQLNFV